MLTPDRTRLEVWGDPVAHSLSPHLHAAAYRVLGLEWTYGRRRVSEAGFPEELAGLSSAWRGLSLTMPLKGAAFRASDVRDRRAELTGAVNTLLQGRDALRGFNTDVGGLVRALLEEGVTAVESARIVGAGATATSALVALAELGAERVDVVARRPQAVQPLAELGARLGVHVRGLPFELSMFTAALPVDVTVSTLPGGVALAGTPTEDSEADDAALAVNGGSLVEVVYGQGRSALAAAWDAAGVSRTDGRGMLLHQALLQVRIFVGGDPDTALTDESDVLAAMRLALVGD